MERHNLAAVEAVSNYTFELPPEPKSGILSVILMGLLIVAGGAGIYMGTGMKTFSNDSTKIHSWATKAKFSMPTLPKGVSVVGAYRELYEDKTAHVFVAGESDLTKNLPKQASLAMEMSGASRPLYYFVAVGPEASSEPQFNLIKKHLEKQGTLTIFQEKIWISKNEIPALYGLEKNNGLISRVLLVPTSDKNLVLIKYPQDKQNIVIQVLASAMEIDQAEISLVSPASTATKVSPAPGKKMLASSKRKGVASKRKR